MNCKFCGERMSEIKMVGFASAAKCINEECPQKHQQPCPMCGSTQKSMVDIDNIEFTCKDCGNVWSLKK